MNGLLFSLPGTPVIYYGDEIGMGDNIYLGDRNGVRTPMQWSGDRNAGFSRANRQRAVLPGHHRPRVPLRGGQRRGQQANPTSLLWWMKRLIALRKRYPAFGRGTLEFLHPDNRKVLAFLRRYEDETILVVANLSRFAQSAELDLSAFEGVDAGRDVRPGRVPADPASAVLPHARRRTPSTGSRLKPPRRRPRAGRRLEPGRALRCSRSADRLGRALVARPRDAPRSNQVLPAVSCARGAGSAARRRDVTRCDDPWT